MAHLSLKKSELQTRADEKLFIDAVFSNIGISTALFLCKIAKPLREDYRSATYLGQINGVTTGAALYHLRRLQQEEYVSRDGYRSWSLGDRYFQLEKEWRLDGTILTG